MLPFPAVAAGLPPVPPPDPPGPPFVGLVCAPKPPPVDVKPKAVEFCPFTPCPGVPLPLGAPPA